MARLSPNLESWMPILVVLLLAMVSGWLWRVVESSHLLTGRVVAHDPDLIMERFASRQLGENGEIRYTLSARKMIHYPDDDTSYFDEVVFASYEPGVPTVVISSQQAVRSTPQDEVIFSGNVVVTRDASKDQSGTVLHTSWLKVQPDRGIAETNQPVKIDYGLNTLTALTMVVNNKTKIAEFTRAHVIYKTPRQH